jgi:hypothetical protein
MSTIARIADPEAATYVLDAAACLIADVATGNWSQAALDAISLAGWIRLAIAA